MANRFAYHGDQNLFSSRTNSFHRLPLKVREVFAKSCAVHNGIHVVRMTTKVTSQFFVASCVIKWSSIDKDDLFVLETSCKIIVILE